MSQGSWSCQQRFAVFELLASEQGVAARGGGAGAPVVHMPHAAATLASGDGRGAESEDLFFSDAGMAQKLLVRQISNS